MDPRFVTTVAALILGSAVIGGAFVYWSTDKRPTVYHHCVQGVKYVQAKDTSLVIQRDAKGNVVTCTGLEEVK